MVGSGHPGNPDLPLSPEGRAARERVEGPIRELVDLTALQAAADPPKPVPSDTQTPSAEPVTEADVKAYLELITLEGSEDAFAWDHAHEKVHAAADAEHRATSPDDRSHAHDRWESADSELSHLAPRARLWAMLTGALVLGIGAAAVVGFVRADPDEPTTPVAGSASVSSAASDAGPATIPVTSVSGLLLMREANASYYGDAVPGSEQSVALSLDPATMQATGILDVAFALPAGSKDADEEYAQGSLRSTFTVPVLAATTSPPPGYPADEAYHWKPAEGSWWFGGAVPVDVAMEGKDATVITRWDDGREEVEYAEASGSTTMTAWISGTVTPLEKGWSTTLTIEHASPVGDEPFWQLSFYTSGAGAVPGLERSAG